MKIRQRIRAEKIARRILMDKTRSKRYCVAAGIALGSKAPAISQRPTIKQ